MLFKKHFFLLKQKGDAIFLWQFFFTTDNTEKQKG